MVAFTENNEHHTQSVPRARGHSRTHRFLASSRSNSASRFDFRTTTSPMIVRLGSCSRDPIGFESNDTNHYRFVFNKPLSLVDPLGLEPEGTKPPGENDKSNNAKDMCPLGWEFVSGPSKDPIHGKTLPTHNVQPGYIWTFNTYEINWRALGPTLQTNKCGEPTTGSFTLTWTKQYQVEGGVSIGYFGWGWGYAFGYGIETSIDVRLPGTPCINYLAVAVGQELSVRHEKWKLVPTPSGPDLQLSSTTHNLLGMLERVNYVTCRSKCPDDCCKDFVMPPAE